MDKASLAAANAGTAAEQLFIASSLTASLTVRDIQRSMDWYRDVVGFTVDQRYDRDGKLQAVALRAGDVRLMIGQDDGAKGWERVKGEGFSLQFTTAQDVDEIAQRIKGHGGTVLSEPADMPWGARVFRVADPDGFRLSISSPRT